MRLTMWFAEDEVSFSVELRKKFKKHAATGASLPVSKVGS